MNDQLGKNIFLLLDSVMKENSIPWQNTISFSADNAAIMIGKLSGVSSFVKKENPDVFILGCPCHLLHLAAEKGASQLPFMPVDLLVPIFYYLEKSSKRHKEFKKFQTMCCVESHAILKHVCTRWLSLERALDRQIEQGVPLKQYFQQESRCSGEKRKIEESAKDSKRQKASGCTAPSTTKTASSSTKTVQSSTKTAPSSTKTASSSTSANKAA